MAVNPAQDLSDYRFENGERVYVSARYVGEPNRYVTGLYEWKGGRHIVHTKNGSFDVPHIALKKTDPSPLDRMAALQAVTSVMADHAMRHDNGHCSCGEDLGGSHSQYDLHLLTMTYERGFTDGRD